ncbi:tetratricopeptide repeat protein 13-like [Liolophura sinensis]|uniref:tetratricopeptide repeat protein 13-like n=1 Tax=Liolophura sinensis TaxID=3198878 RepID=UPI0031590B6E
MVPMATGINDIDKSLAVGIVMLNAGLSDEAIHEFTAVLKKRPKTAAAFYARGVAYARKGLQVSSNADNAIRDLSKAVELDKTSHEALERRSEVYIAQNRYEEALEDLSIAMELHPSQKLFFLRGTLNLISENFAEAEGDFKKNLEKDGPWYILSYYHLGLALYYRGKVRNAIEVFKEILKLKPDHIEACTSLAQAFRELGNLRAAQSRFNQSLSMNPNHLLSLQLQGTMHYHSGNLLTAMQDFKKCLLVDANSQACLYMMGLSQVAVGRFYDGIKSTTKVMVSRSDFKLSPEFLKAHYLREHSRYLHAHLDSPLASLQPDRDYTPQFKDNWVRMLPFTFKGTYKEQPGLQPDIRDVVKLGLSEFPKDLQTLICKAHRVGLLGQVSVDGFTTNRRLNLAMGLASIHIAQLVEQRWKSYKQNKNDKYVGWRDLFEIAVEYRRLVDPEQPVFWLDRMGDTDNKDFRGEISFVRGSMMNLKVMQYFDLVFKLAKTMLEHYTGDGVIFYPGLKEDIDNAKTCEDLLAIARKRKINPNGFLVSTQVPSLKEKSNTRLDGVVLTLTEDLNNKIVLSINVASSKSRTSSYHAEMEHLFLQLKEEIKKSGVNKISDMESMVNTVLSMVYYFYNLMPLSRGSSVVAYSVALGLIMSLGREVTGKIPTGKLVDLEAMLSGAPDAFILVTKQWMNIKKNGTTLSTLPKVWEAFPTVRTVIEALNLSMESC